MYNNIVYLEDFYNKNNCQLPSSLLTEQMDSFYFVKDLEGTFVCVDKSLLKHFKMQNSSEILGKTDYDIQRHDLAAILREDDKIIIKSDINIVIYT